MKNKVFHDDNPKKLYYQKQIPEYKEATYTNQQQRERLTNKGTRFSNCMKIHNLIEAAKSDAW